MGWHPWFRRRLESGSPAVLELEARSMYERGADGLPTGRLRGMKAGPWDDAFCDLIRPPRILWESALQLDLRSDVEDWVIYSEREIGLCVEPQSAPPNAFELGRAAHLPPGGRLKRRFEMRWARGEGPEDRKNAGGWGR
jgi:aldose 1-epimerase